jgi:Ca2+:H+ antiporter
LTPVAELSRLERLWLLNVVAFTAFAAIARYAAVPTLVAFAAATVALAGLAWVVALAIQRVGRHLSPAITGVLQATVGNLPEFFVVIFALNAGELVVAQTALLGSVFANALLVLGVVIVVGARRSSDGIMRFRPRLPQDTATLLILTTFIIVAVSVPLESGEPAGHHVRAISTIAAVALLLVYLAWVIPYVRSGGGASASESANGDGAAPDGPRPDGPRPEDARPDGRPDGARPDGGLAVALLLLIAAGAASAFVSDWFVHALAPSLHQLHVSQAFAGIVIIAIAGNAVENMAGIVLAARGQSDLAIAIVKNSVSQVAAFLFPVLVLVSLALSTTLTFAIAPTYIGALLLTVLAVWQVTGDGEAAAFEGYSLIALYVVLAAVTLYQ